MDAYDYLPVVHSGNSFLERQVALAPITVRHPFC